MYISCFDADLDPILVGFEQTEFTADEGSMVVIALNISGGNQGGFDPQNDLRVVVIGGTATSCPCECAYNIVIHVYRPYSEYLR